MRKIGAIIEREVTCSRHVAINKDLIYRLVNSRGSVEVFTSYYSSVIILILFFYSPRHSTNLREEDDDVKLAV